MSRAKVTSVVLRFAISALIIAFLAVTKWLENYEHRIDIHWAVFAIASLGALLLTLITISFQSMKASFANPVDSLRNE